MSGASSHADRLFQWLDEQPAGATLPTAMKLARLLAPNGLAGPQEMYAAFAVLHRQQRITTVHGTVSVARGHRIVRMLDGREFKTEGCPLELRQ